ncbi:hypothetical protein MKX03_029702, partial [Papaver bracteatum]
MLSNIRSTCDLADQVSGKVSELDLDQSRVYSTLSRIDTIVERGNCIEGAKKLIETEDYESAAKFVLKKIYVNYLKKVISMRSRLEFESLVERIDQNQGRDFVDCLTSLFKDIVLAVEENDDTLRNLCCEDGIVYAIIELQEESDYRGSLVLRKYMEYRKLSINERVSIFFGTCSAHALCLVSYSKNILSVGATEGPDPRKAELYLEEILTLIQPGSDSGFMVSKIRGLRSVDPKVGPRATKSFKNGSFSKVVQEITGFYMILEKFFVLENVRKVIKIDEHVPDSLPTSMVDDVFYVLQSYCRRAISTSSMNSLFFGGVGVQKTGTEIATALNNIDVSGEYDR